MKVSHYSKTNDLKLKYNDKDWNDPEIRVAVYMELDKAKSEGFAEALIMMNAEDIVSKEDKLRDFKEWLYYRETELEGFCEEQEEIREVISMLEEIGL